MRDGEGRGRGALAVDLGASKLVWARVPPARRAADLDLEPEGRLEIEATRMDNARLVAMLADRAQETGAEAIGLAVPGFVREGCIEALPNLPRVKRLDVRRALAKAGVRASVENDVKCMTLAQLARTRGREGGGERADFVLVAPGSGIGGAIVREGKVVRGAHNAAGEFGHMKMADERGRLVDWEALAGGLGLARRFGRAGWDARRILSSDAPAARTHAREAAACFGLGLANVANALDPAQIVVAGSVGAAFMRHYKREVRSAFEAHAIAPVRRTPIALCPLKHPALAGAALLGG